MYGKTTTLAAVPALLCLLACPLQANPGFTLPSAGKGFSVESVQADITEHEPDKKFPYVLLRGSVSAEGKSSLPGGYFHLDVYKSGVGEKKLLVRTGRYQGDIYEVYLNRGFDHTLIFKVETFPHFELQISAEATRTSAKEINLDVVLPAAVAEETTPSEAKAKQMPKVKEIALLPTQPNEIKAISIDLTATDVPALPVKITQPPLPPEQPKQSRATISTSVHAAAGSSLIPLFEEFGGKGEVLIEITDLQLLKLLEQTTSQWWMVAYKSEIGWVNARQLQHFLDQ